MNRAIIFIFLFISTNIWGQKIFKEKLDNCSPTFTMEDQHILLNYKPGDSLLIIDLIKGTEPKDIQKLKGIMAAQIIIDSAGTPCLISYDYKFNQLRKPFEVEENINALIGWEGTGDNTFVSVIFKIYFEIKKISIERLGYNRNTGWKKLSQATFLKEKVPKKKTK